MNRYILDACALIATLNGEPGGETVVKLVQTNDMDIILNKLNLLEVYYDLYRRYGKDTADDIMHKIQRSPVKIIAEITDAVFMEAGRLKAQYRISLADAIALAEASVSGGILVSSDHHEFDAVEAAENISFLWIR